MSFLEKLFIAKINKNKDKIKYTMEKVNNGGTFDDIDTIVDDYFYLIKRVHKGRKPQHIKLVDQDYYMVFVDGIEYDLDALIRHNDQRNNERKMEIEVLISNQIPLSEIQSRLNNKIGIDW